MHKIVAIVGMAGSGKGTATDHLEALGYKKVHFGGMVYDEVARRGLDIVANEREVREDMRRQGGPAVLAIRAGEKAEEYFASGAQTVILDGLYSWSEYKHLKEKYGEDMITIAIFTPSQVRYERVVARRDSQRAYTLEQVKKRDYEEIENLEKGGPIAMADFTMTNSETPQSLTDEIDGLFRGLHLEP